MQQSILRDVDDDTDGTFLPDTVVPLSLDCLTMDRKRYCRFDRLNSSSVPTVLDLIPKPVRFYLRQSCE